MKQRWISLLTALAMVLTIGVCVPSAAQAAEIPPESSESQSVVYSGDQLKVWTNLTGRAWKDNESFTYVMELSDAVPGVELGNTRVTATKENQVPKFGDITFTKSGRYQFNIRQEKYFNGTTEYDLSSVYQPVEGLALDKSSKCIVLNVDADENGLLQVSVDWSSTDELVFTNVYDMMPFVILPTRNADEEGIIGAVVDASISGREWLPGESITLNMKALDGAPEVTEPNCTLTSANQSAFFGVLRINTEDMGGTAWKDYRYAITQVIPEVKAPGVTYDESTHVVLVKTKDNGVGFIAGITNGLVTDEITGENFVHFENTYVPTNAVTLGGDALKITASLTGRDWFGGDTFRFTLAAENEAAKAGIADGSISMPDLSTCITGAGETRATAFGDMHFAKPGTFVFRIAQTDGGASGLTYDTVDRLVTVTVSEQPGDALKVDSVTVKGAEGTDKDNLTFTNTYAAAPGSLSGSQWLRVSKVLNGRSTWIFADSYRFTLALDLSDPYTRENADSVTLPDSTELTISYGDAVKEKAFGDVVFAKAGTYKLLITEVSTYDPDTICDPDIPCEPISTCDPDSTRTVTVTVTEKPDGSKEATASGTGLHTFRNSDAGRSVSWNVPKIKVFLTGKNWTDEQFTYALAPADTATSVAMEKGDVVLPAGTLTLTDDTARSFGSIQFKAAGTYQFTVSAVPGSDSRYTLDSRKMNIFVTVDETAQGVLRFRSVPPATAFWAFSSTYAPGPVSVELEGTVTLSGRSITAGDRWGFTLTEGAGMGSIPMPAAAVVENTADGSIRFGAIRFTEPGQYVYDIKENSDDSYPGVQNDNGKVVATVTVRYNEDTGLFIADTAYEKQNEAGSVTGSAFVFENVYAAAPSDPLNKLWVSAAVRPGKGNSYTMTGGEFTFTLTPGADNPVGDPISSRTVSNQADGIAVMAEEVRYTKPGTYVYTVEQQQGSQAGMTYSDQIYTITVTVTEDIDLGAMIAVREITGDGRLVEVMAFNNSYAPVSTDAAFGGTVTLSGKSLTAKDFVFTLTPLEGAPAPAATEVRNDAGGHFDFGTVTYTKPGVYQYEITQTDRDAAGYTYDTHTVAITVTVTDESGVLVKTISADGQPADAVNALFENTYAPAGTVLGSDRLSFKVSLTGRELAPGEFTLRLAGEGRTLEAVNTADGTVTFDDLEYTQPGEYSYTLTQVPGTLGGVTYSEEVYHVTVDIGDVGGALDIGSLSYTKNQQFLPREEVLFANTYTAAATTVTLGANVTLRGGALADQQFSFELKNGAGEVLQTVKNDAGGAVTFAELTFDRIGSSVYTVAQVTDRSDIILDRAVYTVTVTVTDPGTGTLAAEIAIAKDQAPANAMRFTNAVKQKSADGGASNPNVDREEIKTEDGVLTTETKQDGTVVETFKGNDGSATETTRKPDGSSVTESRKADGTTATTRTDAKGKTEAEVKVSQKAVKEAAKTGRPVELPVADMKPTANTKTAPQVKLNTGSREPVRVTIPVADKTSGNVAIVVHADGTEVLVPKTAGGENGITLAVEDGATVKIVDNAKVFNDVKSENWFKYAVDFVTGRELYAGVGGGSFGPSLFMTRGMLAQVLYNLESKPDTAAIEEFDDVSGENWYARAVSWAADQGVVSGYGDGRFGSDDRITREQVAVMLWNYAGKPAVEAGELNFADADQISSYARNAIQWAVRNGIMSGDGINLNPLDYATRAEVAAMLMNFVNNIYG